MAVEFKKPGFQPKYVGEGVASKEETKGVPYEEKILVPGKQPTAQEAKTLAKVGVKMGVTLNTGNFNSVRLDVSFELPCDPADADDTYDTILGWIDERLGRMTQAVKDSYGIKD